MYDHKPQEADWSENVSSTPSDPTQDAATPHKATQEVYLFTFGVQWNRQDHPILGRIPKNGYIKTVGYDYEEARNRVDQVANNHWAFQYTGQDFDMSLHPGKPFLTIAREDDPDTWCRECGE